MNYIKYILDKMGDSNHIRNSWYNYPCPYHNGQENHFGINFDKNRFHCFVCNITGSIKTLYWDIKKGVVAPIKNKNGNKKLTNKVLHDLKYLNSGNLERYIKEANSYSYNDYPDNIQDWWNSNYIPLVNFEESKLKNDGINYLKKRGLDYRCIDVGFLKELSGRLIFPFYDGDMITYYQGRAFYNMPLKVLNPSEDNGWNSKSMVLYNRNHLYYRDVIAITEGIFDCWKVYNLSGIDSTCLLGKTISSYQIRILKELHVKSIIVFLDSDAIKEAIKLGFKLFENGFNTKVVFWQGIQKKLDPSDLESSFLNRLIEDAIEINYFSGIQLLSLYA